MERRRLLSLIFAVVFAGTVLSVLLAGNIEKLDLLSSLIIAWVTIPSLTALLSLFLMDHPLEEREVLRQKLYWVSCFALVTTSVGLWLIKLQPTGESLLMVFVLLGLGASGTALLGSLFLLVDFADAIRLKLASLRGKFLMRQVQVKQKSNQDMNRPKRDSDRPRRDSGRPRKTTNDPVLAVIVVAVVRLTLASLLLLTLPSRNRPLNFRVN